MSRCLKTSACVFFLLLCGCSGQTSKPETSRPAETSAKEPDRQKSTTVTKTTIEEVIAEWKKNPVAAVDSRLFQDDLEVVCVLSQTEFVKKDRANAYAGGDFDPNN